MKRYENQKRNDLHVFEGDALPEYSSYAVQMKWSLVDNSITEAQVEKLFLKKEYILTLCEYEKGCLAITCDSQAKVFNFR